VPDVIDWQYVNRLLMEMQEELKGLHIKMKDIEALRYLEDPIALAPEERPSGIELRVGLTAELIENVKSALTTNPPRAKFEPQRDGDEAKKNSSLREEFWNAFFLWVNNPVHVLNEHADAQGGLGVGILKAAAYTWPKDERRKRQGESTKDHLARVKALKRKWGPPFRVIGIHPLTFFFRLGAGDKIFEAIEHSWKPRRQVLKDYTVPDDAANISIEQLAASSGQPIEDIRPLPKGVSTSTMALVTEYWSEDLYQVYVNGRLVFTEDNPKVRYFVAVGRTTSSKDPDKFGHSVAEILRHDEPVLNRTLTRMAEAAELLVRKRNTIELPEGAQIDTELDESGNPIPKVYEFKADKAEALPPGAKVVDPFAGAENVYAAMPFIELMLRLVAQHGVAPIFKGIPPGAAGSGYRDNSLYMMAKSQFAYLLHSFSNSLTQLVEWLEELIVREDQEVYIGNHRLRPSDIRDYPCVVSVSVEPLLPQNIIAEGQFYARMHAEGHITERTFLEQGMKMEQPEKEMQDRMEENIWRMLEPILFRDVLQSIGILPVEQPPQPGGEVKALTPGGPGGVQQLMAAMRQKQAGAGESGMAEGGYTRAGQQRQPPQEAGSFPPGQEEPVA
jgi:hypothetical protein